MMNIENTVDYLAYNINYDLPCLSEEDVKSALNFDISYWYNSYNQMVTDYDFVPTSQTDLRTKIKTSPRSRSKSSSESNMDFDQFRIGLKAHRIRLGLTQAEAAKSITEITNRKTSQTSLCRFENNQLHTKNMQNLVPFFRNWMEKTTIY
jgi:DNA-binding XRE family transcriptional regulator